MSEAKVVISINASWNIFNFRRGLIAALRSQGYSVIALAPEDAYSSRLRELGADFIAIPVVSHSTSPIRDLLLVASYYRKLSRIRPSIYLGYTIKPNVYGSVAARLVGAKVINNVAGLGTAFLRRGHLKRIALTLYRIAFRRSHTVFFQNQEDLGLFIAEGIVRPEQARLLPGSGVDLDLFCPSEFKQERGDCFTFLCAGRLLWDKGLREFVGAARLVRQREPTTRFHLLGFLDVANRTAVTRSDVDGWAAEGLIDYLGATDDVRPYIAAADCVVLPSYREGLPRILLEAAAMGKPLIATDVPGCRQVVEDGTNGYLCAVEDAQSLAEAMLKMVRLDSSKRSAMGASARRKAELEFDEKLVVQAYLDAISEALGQFSN